MSSRLSLLPFPDAPALDPTDYMFSDWFRILLTVFLLTCTVPFTVHAQDEEDESDSQLPEIAPQEIEIRGELQLSFPTLQRQPLHGFASPPSVPSVPADRTPYLAPYKQELENLPESLPVPETTSESVTRAEPPAHGFLEFGGGRYASRFAEGRLSLSLTPQQHLSFHADYFGTEGHSPFSGSDVNTPVDEFNGEVRFESRHDALTFAATVRGAGEAYTLYGIPNVVQSPSAMAPTRGGLSMGPEFQLRTHGDFSSAFTLRYDLTAYESQLDLTDAESTSRFAEGRVAFDGSATFGLGGVEAHVHGAATRSTYGGDVTGSSAYTVDAGGTMHLVSSDRLSVRAGARVLTFDAPEDPGQSPISSVGASFVVPEGRAELSLSPGVTLYAENRPRLDGSSLAELYDENPYTEHAPPLRPTLSTTNATSGLRLSFGRVLFQTNVGFEYAPSYQYFVAPDAPGASVPQSNEAPVQVEYESAQIVRGGGEVALQGLTGIDASLGLTLRNGTLIGEDDAIPYFSPLVANAMFSVSFADGDGLLQTTGTIESSRPVDRTGDETVDTFVSFDVETSYGVTSLLDVVAQIKNVGPTAPMRWDRYPLPPTTVMGGFRIHW